MVTRVEAFKSLDDIFGSFLSTSVEAIFMGLAGFAAFQDSAQCYGCWTATPFHNCVKLGAGIFSNVLHFKFLHVKELGYLPYKNYNMENISLTIGRVHKL